MNNNIIQDTLYKDIGLKEARFKVSDNINEIMDELSCERGQIAVLNYLPRLGKTYSLLKYLNNIPNTFSLYVSDVHEQMTQISKNFNKMHIIKGAAKVCPLLDENQPENMRRELNFLFSNEFKRNIACMMCSLQKECIYHKQFYFPEKNIILTIAKESLSNKKLHLPFDFIIFDENMIKHKIIKPYLPEIQNEILESLSIGYRIQSAYENLKILIDNKMPIDDEDILKMYREDAIFLGSKEILLNAKNEIMSLDKKSKKIGFKILAFMANYLTSTEWVEKCYEKGMYKNAQYRPYLHYAFDLVKEYSCNLIMANATFKKDIYNLLLNQYSHKLPEIKSIGTLNLQNKNSYLLNYNMIGKNCSKTGLETYGSDIKPMIISISNFCQKRGLKSGLITFTHIEEEVGNYFNVADHFVAHRGKNDFDDVDVLVILGTFNYDRKGLLETHYTISGEYLEKENLKKWTTKKINCCKINLPQHKLYKETRLYLLYDEHLQAILRSGAHLKPNKVVICFGYVPPEAKNIFTYKTFSNRHSLVNGLLTNIFTKRRKRKNDKL